MPDTDRKKLKDLAEGTATTVAGISNAKTAVEDQHRRTRDYKVTATANADTAVVETDALAYIHRKSRVRGIGLSIQTSVAANATDYLFLTFFHRWNGTSVPFATWNTHTSAQGALSNSIPSLMSTLATGLYQNSNAEIAAGAKVTYSIAKQGAGKAIPVGSLFTFDLEEI